MAQTTPRYRFEVRRRLTARPGRSYVSMARTTGREDCARFAYQSTGRTGTIGVYSGVSGSAHGSYAFPRWERE